MRDEDGGQQVDEEDVAWEDDGDRGGDEDEEDEDVGGGDGGGETNPAEYEVADVDEEPEERRVRALQLLCTQQRCEHIDARFFVFLPRVCFRSDVSFLWPRPFSIMRRSQACTAAKPTVETHPNGIVM